LEAQLGWEGGYREKKTEMLKRMGSDVLVLKLWHLLQDMYRELHQVLDVYGAA